MGLGDLFYPDNPKRRAMVIKLTQKLYDYMKVDFRATNLLTEYLNQNVIGVDLSPISVDEKETIKYNCNVLTQRISEVEEIVKWVTRMVEENLDPAMYRKLTDTDLSLEERIQTANNALHVYTSMKGQCSAAALVLCLVIASGGIFPRMVAVVGDISTSAIGSVIVSSVGGLLLGSIIQAITGAIEREKLEHAIKELESAWKEFVPKSKTYYERIYDMLSELKMHELKTESA